MAGSILPHSFFILTLVGLWRPLEWRGWKFLLYNLYSCFVVLTNFTFTLTEFLDLVLVSSTVNEFTSNLSMMLAMVAACGKIVGVLYNRRQIIRALENLQEKPFKPRDQKEEMILQKFADTSSFITRSYWIFLTVGVTGISLTGIMEAKLPDVLPYRGWLPFNYSQPSIYLLTASQQVVTFFIGCYVDVGFDTLFPGMMLYVSAQISILEYRFKNAVKILHELEMKNSGSELMKNSEKVLIGDWVECHNSVLRLHLRNIRNACFHPILPKLSDIMRNCLQSFNHPNIYLRIYKLHCLHNHHSAPNIFGLHVGASGDTSNLNDAIYSTDWFKLSNSAQKSMIIVALKTFRPVIFMSCGIITLSLESFKSVIKLSYSIYNVLQQS
ncbi:GSCOCT00014069001.2-RA-CDS, partial [Cotesia congregata]